MVTWIISAPVDRTTPSPVEGDNDDDVEDPDQVLMALDFETKSNLAMLLSQDRSRQDMRAMLQRTIDMIDHRPIADRPRRAETFNTSAKLLGRVLSHDPRFGSTSEESECQPSKSSQESEFCEPREQPNKRQMTVASMKKILELKEKKRSNDAIKRIYPKYRSDRLDYYRRCVQEGEPVVNRIKRVNEGVLQRVAEARAAGRAIHGHHLRRWGLELADENSLSREYFSASHTWLYKLKKNGRIGSRKVTEYISRSEENQQDLIDERIDEFLTAYEDTAYRFPRRLTINMDQTPFNYEPTNKRTLSYVGERDTRVHVDQKSKTTHSYTSQPMITRDGKTFGKLLLIMQEQQGRFGPRVETQVRDLERRYGNIRVFASKSGKLTSSLIMQWIDEVFHPAVRLTLRSVDTDTDVGSDIETASIDDDAFEEPVTTPQPARECPVASSSSMRPPDKCYRKPHTLLITDSWSGQTSNETTNDLRRRGIESMVIPPLTTKYIQPLDVYFNRQYKLFVNRLFEESDDPRSGVGRDELNSRESTISFHSIIWNQFGSEAYTDMLRYSWHNTDPHWSVDEMVARPMPRGVLNIQFEFNQTQCQHHDHTTNDRCSRPAFIKCAHCGKILCLKHFLDRACFHEVNEERAGPSGVTRSTTTTTTTTKKPYGAPGTYSVYDIEPMWLGPRKKIV